MTMTFLSFKDGFLIYFLMKKYEWRFYRKINSHHYCANKRTTARVLTVKHYKGNEGRPTIESKIENRKLKTYPRFSLETITSQHWVKLLRYRKEAGSPWFYWSKLRRNYSDMQIFSNNESNNVNVLPVKKIHVVTVRSWDTQSKAVGISYCHKIRSVFMSTILSCSYIKFFVVLTPLRSSDVNDRKLESPSDKSE